MTLGAARRGRACVDQNPARNSAFADHEPGAKTAICPANAHLVDSEQGCSEAVISESGWMVDPTAFIASWSYDLTGQIADSYLWWVEGGVEKSEPSWV